VNNILILGAQGFIGSHLCEYFIQSGYNVTGCDVVEASPADYTYHKVSVLSSDFDLLFKTTQFDICINASGSGNVAFSLTYPQSDFDNNTLTVSKILGAIQNYQPACRLLHISSAAVYGNPQTLPIDELATISPVSPYGFHKHMSEILCREYALIYNVPVIIVRPFSVYGIGLRKQLLWDICKKLSNADSIHLFGTGNETRDFIHINDMVKAIALIVQKAPFDGSVFNLASGVQTTIGQVAAIFEKYFPGNKTIRFSGNDKKGDPVNWLADITKMKTLGFIQQQNMEDNIRKYIDWYLKNV
jgi:UDP-glucose 4-epimerase